MKPGKTPQQWRFRIAFPMTLRPLFYLVWGGYDRRNQKQDFACALAAAVATHHVAVVELPAATSIEDQKQKTLL
jgi:hypothetical protein